MKRLVLFFLIGIFFIGLCSCSSRSLRISDSAFKANVKKIVVLPVYIGDVLIPPLPEQLKEIDYDKNERGLFQKKIKDAIPFFQNATDVIMNKGKFKLETVLINEKEGNDIFKNIKTTMVPLRIDNERTWPLNYFFDLEPSAISLLLSKYKADAVLFHYFQANKRLKTYSWSGYRVTYYVTLPHWYMEYSAVIYDKSGKVLFDKTIRYIQMEEMVSLGGDRYGSRKIPLENLNWNVLNEEAVKKELYQKRGSFYRDFLKM